MFSSVTSSFMAGHRLPGFIAPDAFLANRFVYYDFSNPASYPGTGTLVTDLAGGDNNGTLSGSYTYTTTAPTNNSGTTTAMQITATGTGRLRTPSVSDFILTSTGNLTFVFWMRAPTPPGIILQKTTGAGAGYSFNWRTPAGTDISAASQSGTLFANLNFTANVLTLNSWYMISFSPSVGVSFPMYTYINTVRRMNQPNSQNDPSYIDNTVPLDIKADSGTVLLGEAHMFNTRLTQDNITYLFDLTKARYGY